MAGRPQRDRPKRAIQLSVDETVYLLTLSLIDGEEPLSMSRSQLFESLVLLAREEHIVNAEEDFAARARAMRTRWLDDELRTCRPVSRRSLHLTIGDEALGFLDMLVLRYRPLLRTRGDAASLVLQLAAERLTTRERNTWMKRRLEDVMLKYPVRYQR